MIVLLILITFFIVGFLCGQYVIKRQVANNLANNPDEIIEMINNIKQAQLELEELTEPTEIIIENHNGNFFVYNKKTNQFLGQGLSHELALGVVKERFPSMEFKIANESR